jgi:hypothetical protein
MAWEWVAPTATAVVALGGIAATWLTAKGGRDSQERLQVAQRDETRKLTMRNERQQVYADYAGVVREWQIRSSLQGTFTPEVERQTLVVREAASKMLSELRSDITVDQWLATPGAMARVTAMHAASATHVAGMTPEDTLAALGQVSRLAAAIHIIGGPEAITAVEKVQTALIGPFSSMLTTNNVPEEDQVTLTTAVSLAEKAMAHELHLSDETY